MNTDRAGPGPATSDEAYAVLHETHSGVVVLLGNLALKLKKPLDLGFLDHRSRQSRLEACQEEVRLNRRLAPDMYLGVGDLTGPDGLPMDHVVLMRRAPAAARLSALLDQPDQALIHVRRVARVLAAFHATARRGAEISVDGGPEALLERWRASFATVRPYAGEVIDHGLLEDIEELVEEYVAGRSPLFRRRMPTVVDGHGDLQADDIFCLPDGPRILDCLEFDPALRHVDPVDDAAFLAMDLERLGARDVGDRFLGWYREFSGDHVPDSLVEHYLAYRGFVRAKVECLRHAQGFAGAASEASRLAGMVRGHLRSAEVVLVLVGGPPATGKSTVAAATADRLGLTLLSSDRVRKEMVGISPSTHVPAATDGGIYAVRWTNLVYDELLHRAGLLLAQGESVVVDATWSRAGHRLAARALAGDRHARVVEVQCQAPPEVTQLRAAMVREVTDAGPAVTATLRERFTSWPEAEVVDTTVALETCLTGLARLVRPAPGTPEP